MSVDAKSNHLRACRVSIRGVVQGVGFRPFVYRIAVQHRVAGWVLNGEAGVEIHAEAASADLEKFLTELKDGPPPAAHISHFELRDIEVEGIADFQIHTSQHEAAPTVRISPDLVVCTDCLREMNDRFNRRHGYPYINCTNCGPRYSIIEGLPYDRAKTTMAAWKLCADCRREFENPGDRRYHAQPIACANCGPSYQLIVGDECLDTSDAAIRRAAELLRAGRILAVKGIGGYHLACDAGNFESVEALRARKYRKEKPFAVMVRSLEEARRWVELTSPHEALLVDAARPIVLVPAKRDLPGVSARQFFVRCDVALHTVAPFVV